MLLHDRMKKIVVDRLAVDVGKWSAMKPQLPPTTTCQNCGASTPGAYCSACGQDSRDHRVSMRSLLASFWGDVFTFDSRLTRSLVPLLLRPGDLTIEYLRGRRVRYIPPLRLYLFISFAFFFLLAFRVNSRIDRHGPGTASGPDSATVAAVIDGLAALPDSVRAGVAPETLQHLGARLAVQMAAEGTSSAITFVVMGKDVTDSRNEVVRGMLALAPKAVFLLLPVFAGLLALIYRRARRMFIEHLVFALHYHSVLYLGFILGMLINWDPLWVVLLLAFPLYLLLAMHRVYGQGWGKSLVKLVLLTSAYNFLLLVFFALTAGSSAYLVEAARRHPLLFGWLLG